MNRMIILRNAPLRTRLDSRDDELYGARNKRLGEGLVHVNLVQHCQLLLHLWPLLRHASPRHHAGVNRAKLWELAEQALESLWAAF